MKNILEEYLGRLKVGGRQSHKNLALFPLLSTYCVELDYLLLDEALKKGLIEVREVTEGGSVPELTVENKSPGLVLILDGEELVGAKQNRVVNTTILIQGGATIVIPVSCVEQRRWAYTSPRFSSEERIMSSGLRAMKARQVHESLRRTRMHHSDQGAIWSEIADKAGRHDAPSPSMAMSDIYNKERPSLDEFVKHFHLIESQVGAVFMINGRVAGMDGFGKPDTFSKVFRKLLESYALDAIDWLEPDKEHKALKSLVTEFLKAGHAAEVESHPPVGSGQDIRLSSDKVTGFALCLEGKLLHLSIFGRTNGNGHAAEGSRMARFSRRSRYRQ